MIMQAPMFKLIKIGLLGLGILGVANCGPNTGSQPNADPNRVSAANGSVAAQAESLDSVNKGHVSKGQALYAENCLSCHQANGGGVPNMQPALTGSGLLGGDPPSLIEFVLTAEREGGSTGEWLGVMPAFDVLSDEEIAAILTYARGAFASSGAVSPADVASVRQKIAK